MQPSYPSNQGYPSNQVDFEDTSISPLYPPVNRPTTPPGQPLPSAPPMGVNNLPAVNISWNNLPAPAGSTGLSERVVAASRRVLPTAKWSLGGAAVFAGFFFTATPAVVLGTVCALALGAFGCHKAGQKIEQSEEASNTLKLQQRTEIKEAFERGEHGYSYFRDQKKYSEAVFTDAEFNTVFVDDIRRMTFLLFVQKHGNQALGILDGPNCAAMKLSFIGFAGRELTLFQLKNHYPQLELLQLEKVRAERVIVEREIGLLAEGKLDYEQFIARNGIEILGWTGRPEHQGIVRNKLEAYLLQKNIGYLQIIESYSDHLKYVAISQEPFFQRDFAKLLNSELEYLDFRSKNGLQAIRKTIQAKPETKAQFADAFSKLPYYPLTSLAHEEDRALFSIKATEINTILTLRWNSIPFAKLLEDDQGFVDSIGKVFKGEDWREKALNETRDMSVRDIALKLPGLFQSGVLDRNSTILFGPSIEQRLANETASVTTLEDLINHFPKLLFERRVLHRGFPKVAQLVSDYISANNCAIFFNNPKTPIQLFIEEHALIPIGIVDAYQATVLKIALWRKKFGTSESQIHKDINRRLEEQLSIRDQFISLSAKEIENKKQHLEHVTGLYKTHVQRVQSLEASKDRIYSEQQVNKQAIQATSKAIEKLTKDKSILESTTSSYERIQSESQKIQQKLDSISKKVKEDATYSRLEQEVISMTAKKASLAEQKSLLNAIEGLREEIRLLQNEINPLQEKVSGNDFVLKKAKLEKSIAERKSALDQSVTGAIAALGAITQRYVGLSAEESSLAEMLKDEKVLQNKKETLNTMTQDLARKSSQIQGTVQNVAKSLEECKDSLEKHKSKRDACELELTRKFGGNELEQEKVLLVKTLQDLEQSKKRLGVVIQEIQEAQLAQKQQMVLDNKLAQEYCLIDVELSSEKNRAPGYSNVVAVSKGTLELADYQHNSLLAAANQQYNAAVQALENGRKVRLETLHQELQAKISSIVSKFKQAELRA